jgi:hypothetical protein
MLYMCDALYVCMPSALCLMPSGQRSRSCAHTVLPGALGALCLLCVCLKPYASWAEQLQLHTHCYRALLELYALRLTPYALCLMPYAFWAEMPQLRTHCYRALLELLLADMAKKCAGGGYDDEGGAGQGGAGRGSGAAAAVCNRGGDALREWLQA